MYVMGCCSFCLFREIGVSSAQPVRPLTCPFRCEFLGSAVAMSLRFDIVRPRIRAHLGH